jgi:hypothetical protein
VELNEKDVRDITQLLSGLPVGAAAPGSAGTGSAGTGSAGTGSAGTGSIDTGRFGQVLASDWGWWRTVTGSLAKLPALLEASPDLIPPAAPFDPLAASRALLEVAESVPKGVKWRLRANVGDRVRWYELPEEVAH